MNKFEKAFTYAIISRVNLRFAQRNRSIILVDTHIKSQIFVVSNKIKD